MRLVMPAIARARRVGVRPAVVGTSPAASAYWGSYAANPSFTNAGLPASIQTYDSEAVSIWNDVWDTQTVGGFGSTLENTSLEFNAYDHRHEGVAHAYGVADLMWMTGNPAYLTHAESYVSNMLSTLTGSYSRADIFGGRMLDPDKQTTPSDATTSAIRWISIRLNEPNYYVCLALYTRLLHENGTNPSLVATAITRLQEHWRRWHQDAWLSGSTPTTEWSATRTPAATASLTHAYPDPMYRNFTHPLSQLASVAWTLYKLTGNTNYHAGFVRLLEWIGLGVGYEQGVTPPRATWVHMPNSTFSTFGYTGQAATYTDHSVSAAAHYWDRENAWVGTWPYGGEAINRGLAYYMMSDAASFSDSVRNDAAGGGYLAPIVTTPFAAGGIHHAEDGSFTISHAGTARISYYRNWFAVIPYSEWFRDYSLAQRASTGMYYWRTPSIPAGLIEYELRSLS